ncbi:MAG: energy transducer TonB [Thermoanaerobaculia bacterium]|nr:energy transducer TonB [Thermoanaerobaculia bacterium]
MIEPREISSQQDYFEDKADGQVNAGGIEGKNDGPRATLYTARADADPELLSSFRLVNDVAPVSALVSDDGRYLVTFDNWHHVGYGDDVVVIYRSSGELVSSHGLEDLLTEQDITMLPRSVSSHYWAGEHRIDEERDLLKLEITRCRFDPDCAESPAVLMIGLETGEPLGPKRQLLPNRVATVEMRVARANEILGLSAADLWCSSERARQVLAETDVADLEKLPADAAGDLPEYPAPGIKIGITGIVILELLVDEDGAVQCISTLKSLPMKLTEATRTSLRSTRFERQSSPVRIRVVTVFEIVEEPPPGPES